MALYLICTCSLLPPPKKRTFLACDWFCAWAFNFWNWILYFLSNLENKYALPPNYFPIKLFELWTQQHLKIIEQSIHFQCIYFTINSVHLPINTHNTINTFTIYVEISVNATFWTILTFNLEIILVLILVWICFSQIKIAIKELTVMSNKMHPIEKKFQIRHSKTL